MKGCGYECTVASFIWFSVLFFNCDDNKLCSYRTEHTALIITCFCDSRKPLRTFHMQASMGPAASTLNSFLDMYDPTNMGSEELVEAHLLQARKDLIRAVRSSGDCTTLVEQLVHLKCPVSMKYAQLNVGQLLRDNNRVGTMLLCMFEKEWVVVRLEMAGEN